MRVHAHFIGIDPLYHFVEMWQSWAVSKVELKCYPSGMGQQVLCESWSRGP